MFGSINATRFFCVGVLILKTWVGDETASLLSLFLVGKVFAIDVGDVETSSFG